MSKDYRIEIHPWNDKVQQAVYRANPDAFAWIDQGVNKSDRFVLANYAYGANVSQYSDFQLPLINDNTIVYHKVEKNSEIRKILGDEMNFSPFGFISKGFMEIFWHAKDRIIPKGCWYPGQFFGTRTLTLHPKRIDYFEKIWHMTSGARTLALLPSIKDTEKHKRLKKTYHLKSPLANEFIKHAPLFREICQAIGSSWHTELILFSAKTTDAIRYSKRFTQLRSAIIKNILSVLSFDGNPIPFNFIWGQFIRHIEQQGIKEYPHVYNLAKHLILVALGEEFAFAPACSTQVAPIDALAQAFVDVYKLRYFPSFIHAQKLKPEDKHTVYYSLQYSMHTNPFPSKRTVMTGLDDLRNVKAIHEMFMSYINQSLQTNENNNFIFDRLKKLKFSYFHTVKDGLKVIKQSDKIAIDDPRFLQTPCISQKPFCASSSFFKGYVKIENTEIMTKSIPSIIHPNLKF